MKNIKNLSLYRIGGLTLVIFICLYSIVCNSLMLYIEIQADKPETIQLFYDNLSEGYPFDEINTQKISLEQGDIRFKIPYKQVKKIRLDFDGENKNLIIKSLRFKLLGSQIYKLDPNEIQQTFDELHDMEMELINNELQLTKTGTDAFIVNNDVRLPLYGIGIKIIIIGIAALLAAILYMILIHTLDFEMLKKAWLYRTQLALIIVFLSLLYLPNLLVGIVGGTHSNENRKLKEKPEFSWTQITSYPKEYEAYYTDHLPFKNQLSKLNSYIKYKVLNTSPAQYVIKGAEGWLFYNSKEKNDGDTLGDYTGVNHCTAEELEYIKEKVIEKQAYLNDLGIDFYIFVAPNKSTVYSRYMPAYYQVINETSKVDEIVDYLRTHTTVPIIYPKDQLIAESQTLETYYKLDTHWNALGAYIGFSELMQAVDNQYQPIPLEALEMAQIPIDTGDLAGMINANGFLEDTRYEVSYKSDIVPTLIENNDSQMFRYTSHNLRDDKILMFRDSFASALIPYVSKEFAESMFIWSHDFDKQLIEAEKPDIVVLEVVERYVDALTK